MKYSGKHRSDGIEFPVSFDVNNGRIENFKPSALEDKLYGAALLAHLNFQHLLQGCVERLPTPIEVFKKEAPLHEEPL